MTNREEAKTILSKSAAFFSGVVLAQTLVSGSKKDFQHLMPSLTALSQENNWNLSKYLERIEEAEEYLKKICKLFENMEDGATVAAEAAGCTSAEVEAVLLAATIKTPNDLEKQIPGCFLMD